MTERDPFDAEGLRRRLTTRWLGKRIEHLDVTQSTNDVAWKLAEGGCPSGTVVFAEQQERGRGSRGRVWHSRPGAGLLMSIVLRLDLPPHLVPALTSTVSTALARAIRETTPVRPRILWPNDLTVDGRKIAGILVESRSPHPESGATFIAGLGLNVNQTADELPDEIAAIASSLRIAAGAESALPREPLARRILEDLEQDLDDLAARRTARLEEELSEHSVFVGHPVELELEQDRGTLRGRIETVSLTGTLHLRDTAGTLHEIAPEHVRSKRLVEPDPTGS